MHFLTLNNRDLALVNTIERVFPNAKHLLCRWHVNKNVIAKCKKLFATKEIWEKFMMSWNVLLLSSSEDEFITRLNALQQDFISYPQTIEYVTSTWLDKYKENFVSAWTYKIMHFGNLTTNKYNFIFMHHFIVSLSI